MMSIGKVFGILILSLALVQGLNHRLAQDILKTAVVKAANFISDHTSATNEWHPLETPSAILGLISANPARRETAMSKYDVIALKEALLELVSTGSNRNTSALDGSTLTQFISAFQASCVDLTSDELGTFGSSALYREARTKLRSTNRRSPAIPGLVLALCNDKLPVSPRIIALLSLPQSRNRIVCSSLCLEKAAMNVLAVTCLRRDTTTPLYQNLDFQRLIRRKLELNIGYIYSTMLRSDYKHTLFNSVLILQVASVTPEFSLSEKVEDSLYRHILRYQKSDGSFGGSVTLTALVIPALTNFTMLDIGQRDCTYKEERVSANRRSLGVLRPDDILIKYRIEDVFSQSQQFVGEFSTKKGTTLAVALQDFKKENGGVFDFKTLRTQFGLSLTSLMDIDNSQVATWNVYQNSDQKVADLSKEVINADTTYVFKFEQVKGV